MDVLLSLPIVSYFLAPAMTSWSTSLNLLFFYMTWTTLVLSHGPLKIELIGVLGARIVLWLIPSLFFLLVDTLLPSLAESIKTGGFAALPPQDLASVAKLVGLALGNLVLAVGLEAGVALGYMSFFKTPIFKTSTTLPLPWQLIKHVALLLAAREVLTYYLHRYALHNNSSSLARLHKQYAHARRAPPFSMALFADHPLPFLVHRILPIYLPALALRPHLLVYFLFVAFSTVEEMLANSGYSIIPGIIMGGITRRTAIHYASGGNGNYGAWGLLDWIHGTSRGPDVIEDVRGEAEKHRVKQKSGKAANDAVSMVQGGLDNFRSTRSRTRRSAQRSPDS